MVHVQKAEVRQVHDTQPLLEVLPLGDDAQIARFLGGPNQLRSAVAVRNPRYGIDVCPFVSQGIEQQRKGPVSFIDQREVEGRIQQCVLPVTAGVSAASDQHQVGV